MSVNTNKIDGANCEITATIQLDDLNISMEKIAKKIAQSTNIDGFRKGKVPITVIKKKYKDRIENDANSQALQDILEEGLATLNLNKDQLIGEPQVTKFDKIDNIIEVSITVFNRPKFDLGDYTKLVPKVKKPDIDKLVVTQRIQELAQSQAPFVRVKNRSAISGDTLVIDFDGSINGKAFPNGKADDFTIKIGSGQLIAGFEEQLIGLNEGQSEDITVSFPNEYSSKDLAGKEALFKIKVKLIQEKQNVSIDQELVTKILPNIKDANVDILHDKVKEQMILEELSKLYNETLKPKFIDQLVDHYAFDIPKFIIEQEIDNAIKRKTSKMNEIETAQIKEDKEKLNSLRKSLKDDVIRSIKATFIVDALATAEKVSVSEDEVSKTIYYEAVQSGQNPQKTIEQYKKIGYFPSIQMAMIEDRLFFKLFNATIKED